MLIQILVENAIKHGLRPIDKEKQLTIRAEQDGDSYKISVEDNGKGFDCTKQSVNSTATGLNVVRQTVTFINSANKSKMHFSISNVTAADGTVSGCRATLTIPKNISFTNYK